VIDPVVGAVVECLRKQGVPEVEAVVAAVQELAEDHWREVAGDAAAELEAELAALPDTSPTSDVDPLAERTGAERRRLLETLVAALLLSFRRGLERPLPARRRRAVREAAERLLATGARTSGGSLRLASAPAQETLLAAERDLTLLLRGRALQRADELERLVRLFLTDGAVRVPAEAGAGGGREAWRQELRAVLGLEGPSWVPATVAAWAYRWHNVGGFLAATAGAVAPQTLVAFNNPPDGPDASTTPFCGIVHGRVVAVGRARQQLERYRRAVLSDDLDAAVGAWPLLSSGEANDVDRGRALARFAGLGLPPYHWECRTVVIASALAPAAR